MQEQQQGKRWQASIWVETGEEQQIVVYGATLHALRLAAHERLLTLQPKWFSNTSPNQLNHARMMQQVVIRREIEQSPRGTMTRKKSPATRPPLEEEEPEITAEMVERYPLIFPAMKAAPEPPPHDAPGDSLERDTDEKDLEYWLRDEVITKRVSDGGTLRNPLGSNRFERFEDAVTVFLQQDLLPERGPDFYEELFTTDVEFFCRVQTVHQERNEDLINDYLSRGWYYNGQMQGEAAPHHTSGDRPIILLLYHFEALAR